MTLSSYTNEIQNLLSETLHVEQQINERLMFMTIAFGKKT